MINTPLPPQIAEIIARIEAAQSSGSMDTNESDQLEMLVEDAEEHLARVAQPMVRGDKGGNREPPTYALGPQTAQTAQQALSSTPTLRRALAKGNLAAALEAARQIEKLFGQ